MTEPVNRGPAPAGAQGPAAATGAGAPDRRWGHLPALDGLRGVAVIAVLLFHGGVGWAQGGFLGVDMFFVLSGFLITSLLLEERGRTGGLRLGAFWARRARRLLPALLLLLAATAAFAAFVASPDALAGIRSDVAATLAYVANWHFIAQQSSYFARTADPSPLAHTWSLAIEEQFYLLWPLLVLLVARGRRPLLKVGVLAGAGVVASATAMAALYHPGGDPSRVYYGTDTRSQVILVGAVLAVIVTAWRRRAPVGAHIRARRSGVALGVLGAAALVAIGGAIVVARGWDAWLYRGGLLAVAVGVAAVIAAVATVPKGALARLLSWRPLAATGRISYGLYLWHWPLYLVIDHARTGATGYALLAIRLAVTVSVSLASYWLVEMPVRRGALPRWQAVIALPASVTAVVAAVLVATSVPLTPSPAAAISTTAAVSAGTAAAPHKAPTRPALVFGQVPKVMIVGDSVGETLGTGLSSLAKHWGLEIDNEATLGCGIVRGGPYRYFGAVSPELPQCETWPARWSELISRHDPDVVFMVVGRWEVMDRMYQGQWTRLGDPAFDRYLTSELDRAVEVLSARGAQIALATTPYFLRGERPDGGRWPEDDPARVDQFNGLLRDVASRHPDVVTLVDLGGHTSVGGVYTKYIDGLLMRYDGVHFTPQADRWLAPWLFPQLVALAPAGSSLPATAPTVPETVPTTVPHVFATYRPATTTTRPRTVTTPPPATTTTPTTRPASTTTAKPPATTPTTAPRPTTSLP